MKRYFTGPVIQLTFQSLLIVLLIQKTGAQIVSLRDSAVGKPPVAGKKAIESAVPRPSLMKPEILDFKVGEISQTDPRTFNPKHLVHVDYKINILISHPRDFLLQRPSDNTELILFADGFPLKGMKTDYFTSISRQDATDTVKVSNDKLWIPFIFKRDSTNKEAWNSIFHLARWNQSRIRLKLSLGWSGMFPMTSIDNNHINTNVTLVFFKQEVFWTLVFCYLLFILFFIYLCHSTGLIRDPDLDNKGPYSLAQTQLAFWTVIIIGGFIYLIMLTGFTDALNDSILLLLGISGGTTGIASFIDYYKKQATNQTKATAVLKKHRTFLLDILSDGVNVSVQRTQTVMWNLVLGLYFIWYVITNKSMPAFSNTLLLVASVSSVLYLGSKGPENPVTPAQSPTVPHPIITP
jgi:hypothetical protein